MGQNNKNRLGPDHTRRDFLRTIGLGAGAIVLAACTQPERLLSAGAGSTPTPSQPWLPAGLLHDDFFIHNPKPLAIETRRERMPNSTLTPTDKLFIRNNLPMPEAHVVANADNWALHIEGVATPQSLKLSELKELKAHTLVAVLQCSGNGRAFFEHGPSGSPWALGAAGCVEWKGVLVSDVLAHLGGTTPKMNYLTATGGDPIPDGVDRLQVLVERSIPLEKGLRDCLLAWELNGEPIPLSHGGPLRLIVPGYFGCNNIKYIRTLACTAEQSPSKIQQKGYRFRPIGTGGAPSQPSMWRMPVKSWVNAADPENPKTGNVRVHGFAFSGERGIAKVEVSSDDGNTWQQAEMAGPDLGSNAWRSFTALIALTHATTRVVSRATDTAGDIQPQNRVENERGYGHNGWKDAALTLHLDAKPSKPAQSNPSPQAEKSPTETKPQTLSPAAERGKKLFAESANPPCAVCHTLEDAEASGALGPNLDTLKPTTQRVSSALKNGVGIMPSYAETLTDAQIDDLAQYLSEVTR